MPHHLGAVPDQLHDDALVALSHKGSVEALDLLFGRYRRLARAKARTYFLVGADVDDIEQEGMIGLFKAVRDFRPECQSSFRAFADLCVTRQIISAIKAASRQKHRALNQYVSLSGPRAAGEPGERGIEELLDRHHLPDPADQVVCSEQMDRLGRAMGDMLSELEVDVLRLYVDGRSYQEISDLLGRHVKAIDNALQRIKRKLEAHLEDRRAAELAPAVA
jgi:RNA polymerase sporulation-specific sigma factor